MFVKNTEVLGFSFTLISKVDSSPIVSGVINAYYTIDGSAQGTLSDTAEHIGNGQWVIDLSADELNGETIGLLFTETSAIPVSFTIKTEVPVTAGDIVEELLNTNIHDHIASLTIGEAFHRLRYLQQSIYVDTEALVNGDGSQGYPYNSINDAKDKVEASGIKNIFVSGEITVPQNLKNMNIYGIGLPKIHLNNQDLKNTKFHHCSLFGSYTDYIIAQQCRLENDLLLRGHFDTCEIMGNVIVASSSEVLMVDCMSGIAGLDSASLSMNSGEATQVSIQGHKGRFKITSCDHALDTITVGMSQGLLTYDNTCTNGTMVASGVCKFINETNGANVIDETITETIMRYTRS